MATFVRRLRFVATFSLLLFPIVGCTERRTAADDHLVTSADGFSLQVSAEPDRSAPEALEGQVVSGSIYVSTAPEGTDIERVRFWLDDPTMSGPSRQLENNPPYDFAGGNAATARPFDTTKVGVGAHIITARIDLLDGSREVVSAEFLVANPPDQIHLAWVDDPSTTLTVVWRTLEATTPSEVQYRQAGRAAWQTATGTLRPSGTTGTLHEVTLTSLSPATRYEYRVRGVQATWSEIHTTRTAPPPGPADFDVVFVADTGIVGRTDGLTTGTRQVIDEIAALSPLLVLGGGDYAYFNTDERFGTLDDAIDAWFVQMQPVLARSVFMPTYGNHEIRLLEKFQTWADRFATPAGFQDRRFYSFDVGDVHFVSILAEQDSVGLTQAQLDWIRDDIVAAQAAGTRWIIPYFHSVPFADGRNHPANLELRAQLGPLFESLEIDVVLFAHDQSFERTYPLIDVPATNAPTSDSLTCYTKSDGVTWIKASPGGKLSNRNRAFSTFTTNPAPPWVAFRDDTRHHIVKLSFSAAGSVAVTLYGIVGDGTPPIVQDSFEYIDGECETRVVGFTLLDADTDLEIGPLQDGDTLDLAALPTRNLNVRADTDPPTVGSVRFSLNADGSFRTENSRPYAAFGDKRGDYNLWTPDPGTYTLGATPYRERSAGGSAGSALSVTFDVIDE